jgi:hypothetical protein
MPSLSSSRKMKALTILGHGFKVLAFGLLPRARVETTSRHRRCVGDAKVACRGGVKGRRRIGSGRVWVEARCVRGGPWTWEEDGVVVGPEEGARRVFYKPRDQERRTREQSREADAGK